MAASSSKAGEFYEVERIVERRKTKRKTTYDYDYEYLLKWKGWSMAFCNWEPSKNMTPDLLRSYKHPTKPVEERIDNACRNLFGGVVSYLKGKTVAPIYINMELEVWRFIIENKGIPSQHKGYMLYERMDFERFETLPSHWFYVLNQHREGIAVDFPIKAKTVLSWTPSHYIVNEGKLERAPKIPVEKISFTIAKKACNLNNID